MLVLWGGFRPVRLVVAGGGDGDGVTGPVLGDGEFDVIPAAMLGEVCNVFVGGIVLGICPEVPMNLITSLDRRDGGQRRESARLTSLGGAIAHHCDGGREGADEQGIIAHVQAVMADLVNIHDTHQINRANQVSLNVPSEITAIEEAKAAEFEQGHDAVGII